MFLFNSRKTQISLQLSDQPFHSLEDWVMASCTARVAPDKRKQITNYTLKRKVLRFKTVEDIDWLEHLVSRASAQVNIQFLLLVYKPFIYDFH